MWTGVLATSETLPIENLNRYASNAHLKLIEGHGVPNTITNFLSFHIMQCDGLIQRSRVAINRRNKKKSIKCNDLDENPKQQLIHLCGEENWMGLNACYKLKNSTEELENTNLETGCDVVNTSEIDEEYICGNFVNKSAENSGRTSLDKKPKDELVEK